MARYALILNGDPAENHGTDAVQRALTAALQGRGLTVSARVLRDEEFSPCTGCFGCWIRTPGECVIDDGARTVTAEIIRSSVLVLLTPVTFGGYSWRLKMVLDRSIGLVLPDLVRRRDETRHPPRYDRYPRLIGIGLADHEGKQETGAQAAERRLFCKLVWRNSLNFMSPGCSAEVLPRGLVGEDLRARLERVIDEAEVW